MEQLKILVADDEARVQKPVRDFLQVRGLSVMEVTNGEEAVDIFFAQKDIVLILPGVTMPKMDGWEACKAICRYSQAPVIMLTTRSEERDELQDFSLGVDEYISKSFSPEILTARVKTVLRRSKAISSNVTDVGGICINKAAHQVTIGDKPIDLSYKGFGLLTYFAEDQELALSGEKILNNVRNYDYFGDTKTVGTHVKKLHSKLGSKGDYIKTIWGMRCRSEVEA